MNLWDANEKIASDAEKRFLRSLTAVQKEIFKIVMSKLYDFPIEGGRFVTGRNTADLINEITRLLRGVLADSDYRTTVTDMLLDLDGIAENTAAAHKEINGISISKNLLNSQKLIARDQVISSLIDSNVDGRFISPMKRIIYSRVNFGTSITETEKLLREFIQGADGDLGILQRYAGQVVTDTFNGFEGAINQKVKEEYNLTVIAYVNSLVEDSRKQCIRWVNMGEISDDVLEDEIAWAYNNGSGMRPFTVPENFCENRGGFKCRHTAYPIR